MGKGARKTSANTAGDAGQVRGSPGRGIPGDLSADKLPAHKTNSQGRYVMVGSPWELLDTQTGDFWTRRYPVETIIGDDTSDVYQWELFTPGPANTKADTTIRITRR